MKKILFPATKMLSKKVEKFCQVCGDTIVIYVSDLKYGRGKVCSNECAHIKRYGPRLIKKCEICNKEFVARKNAHRIGQAKFCSKSCQSSGFKGDANPSWKGDNASYGSLHCWVRDNLGKPPSCDHCGEIGHLLNNKWNIQWANKSHQYKRDLSDWIPLCVSCHRKFDGVKDETRSRLKNIVLGRDRNLQGQFV